MMSVRDEDGEKADVAVETLSIAKADPVVISFDATVDLSPSEGLPEESEVSGDVGKEQPNDALVLKSSEERKVVEPVTKKRRIPKEVLSQSLTSSPSVGEEEYECSDEEALLAAVNDAELHYDAEKVCKPFFPFFAEGL
jgi:hypothetical protein